jgi:AMMECR1 domain-containing protein
MDKIYIESIIEEIISKLQTLIDVEIDDAYRLKKYENIQLEEIPRIDTYITIIKLLKKLQTKSNESI